jgi:hypothetical protein
MNNGFASCTVAFNLCIHNHFRLCLQLQPEKEKCIKNVINATNLNLFSIHNIIHLSTEVLSNVWNKLPRFLREVEEVR